MKGRGRVRAGHCGGVSRTARLRNAFLFKPPPFAGPEEPVSARKPFETGVSGLRFSLERPRRGGPPEAAEGLIQNEKPPPALFGG